MEYIWKGLKNLEIAKYLNRHLVNILCLLGAHKIYKEFIEAPLWGIWSQLIRPRRNLKARYQCEWVAVTGASDGIGECICHEFAKSGFNIVMISRTLDKLNKVSNDIQQSYGVSTSIVQYDFKNLNSPEAASNFEKVLSDQIIGFDVGIVVNTVG